MVYVLIIFILISGYYTFTYGMTMLKEDKNLLGGFATITVAVLSTIMTIFVLITRQM